MSDGLEKRGVSLALMEAVCAFALGQNAEPGHWTIGRLGALVVGNHEILKAGNRWGVAEGDEGEAARLATLTFGEKCSLIDVLERHHRETPHPILGLTYGQSVSEGKASVFMSFAYAADYPELVDAVKCWLEGEGEGAAESTFIWFDLFVNNQWVALEKDFVWWATTFRTAIQDIGRTVLILLPWNAPIPLTRAWCLYEIHCSANLAIALSREQQRAFRRQLEEDVDGIKMALSKIDLTNADCYLPEDKEKIFAAVGDGIHEFNKQILAMLRDWLADAARKVVGEAGKEGADSTIGDLANLVRVANLLSEQGRRDEAGELYERALAGREAQLGPSHPDTLSTVNNLATLRSDQGRLDEAGELYERALAGFDAQLGPSHPSTLGTVGNLAGLRKNQGRRDEAGELYERALAGKEAQLGHSHPDTLMTVNNLANLRLDQGRLNEAGELYERAFAGREAQLGPSHPSTLGTVDNLANLRLDQGRLDEAGELYERALAGKEAQ